MKMTGSPHEMTRVSHSSRPRRSAFSLIELLTVIAIMALMVAALVPGISSVTKGSQMNQALAEVGGLLEEARQYAIAKNTYVWVAFNDDRASAGESQLKVAVLASKNGTDLPTWGVDDLSASQAKTILLNRVRTFNQVLLSENKFSGGQIPNLPALTGAAGTSGSANFAIRSPLGTLEKYTKAIQFTPAGEARNAANLVGMLEIGLQPTRGNIPDEQNIAVVRINGLTGQSMIYRP